MTDQALDVLKLVLLALLYLFFARVLFAVWSEVRAPRHVDARESAPTVAAGAADPTAPAARPQPAIARRSRRPAKGRQGRAGRLVILEPKARRGTAFAIGNELTIGRDDTCTIVVPDDTFVSGRHARVFDHDGQSMVEDCGSTNGSFLNGNKLQGIKLLHPGDRLQIGYTVLEAQ